MSLTEKEIYKFGHFILDPTERVLSCENACFAHSESVRYATLLGAQSRAHPHQRRTAETGLAGHLRRRS
jgi:hypothetical protein